MTQVFTGSGLGLRGSSWGELGSYGPKGSAGLGQGGESVYVNAATGNLVLQQKDGFLASAGLGLDIFQTYNSQGGGAFRFNTQSRISIEGEINTVGSVVRRIDEDGHVSEFRYNREQQQYLAIDGSTARINFSDSLWHYSEGDDGVYSEYSTEGQLLALRDRDHHFFCFEYDRQGQISRISDTNGRQSVIWSFSQGLLREVTWTSADETVHKINYEYDDLNRLTRVVFDMGTEKCYWIAYDYVGDTNLICDIRQSDGVNLHIDYDSAQRVCGLRDAEGNYTRYIYGEGYTDIINELNERWRYSYDEAGRLISLSGPEGFERRYLYDDQHLTAIFEGNLHWKFRYNNAGDCIWMESPTGEIIERFFDAEHHLLRETRYQSFNSEHHPEKPQNTRYVYDAQGHLRFEIDAEGTVIEYRYDTQGARISRRCWQTHWQDAQSTDSLLTEQELANWCETLNPQAVTLTDYHYDWRGQLLEEIHYLQVDTSGEGILNDNTPRSDYHYDSAGRLVEKSWISEQGLSHCYYFYDDLGRLIKTIDSKNQQQTFDYDDAHQRLLQTDANGLQTLFIYDKRGFLLSKQQVGADGIDYGTVSYTYDVNGQMLSETSVDGLTRYWCYDAAGRLKATISAAGEVCEYYYDAEERIIGQRQYAHHLNTKTLQQPINYTSLELKASEDDHVSRNIYDDNNQLAYQIDAQGAVTGFQYDAQGRLIGKTAYANRLQSFESAAWPLDLSLSADDRDYSYYYDSLGRLQAEVDGEGGAITYTYDQLGNCLSRCRHANKVLQRSGDWSQDAPQASANDRLSLSLYNAAGLKIADIDAEGYLIEYRYDSNGLLLERIAYYQKLANPTLSTLDALRPQANSNDRRCSYHYDEAGQLIEETNSNGLSIRYRYNEQGLVISTSRYDIHTQEIRQQRLRYDALGRIISRLDEQGAALLQQNDSLNDAAIEEIWQNYGRSYTYDKAGRLLSETNSLQQTNYYVYNETGQLAYTLSADGALTAYRYTSFNQIESKQCFSNRLQGDFSALSYEALQLKAESLADERFDEVSRYRYNVLGQLVSEQQGNASILETDYNAFGEVIQTRRRSTFATIRTEYQYDHRGMLLVRINDADGLKQQWQSKYNTFGELQQAINPLGAVTRYSYNHRGEQRLIETALQGNKILTYDAFGRILSIKERDTVYSCYDDVNNTLTVSHDKETTGITTYFNAFGDRVRVTDANGQSTTYSYDTAGQLIRVEAPEQQITEYHYDTAGHLLLQHTVGGQTVEYRYDAAGRIFNKIIDPDGLALTCSYRYDALGRQLEINEAGRCNRFTYDSNGHLIEQCLDANGLRLSTSYEYDSEGNLCRKTEHNSKGIDQAVAYTWDALGRQLSKTIDPDGLALTTRNTYDANGNLIMETDANGHSSHYVYDSANLCRFRINARGVVTEYRYDLQGNIIETITYAHRITDLSQYNESTLKAAIEEDAVNDHFTFYAYDSKNRLHLTYDGEGYATSYCYDKNGNMLSKEAYSKPCSLSALKNGERPTPDNDAQTRCTRFAYDGLNHQRLQIDANGTVTTFRYDQDGQLIEKTRLYTPYNGQEISDSLAEIESHLQYSSNDEFQQFAYDAAGRLSWQVSGNGSVTGYQYDALGNCITTCRYAQRLTLAQRASKDWPLQVNTNADDRMTRSLYDAAGRECYRLSAGGLLLERRYDDCGNILQEISYSTPLSVDDFNLDKLQSQPQTTADHVNSYYYDAAARLLEKDEAGLRKTAYTYDQNGNLSSKTEANGACWTYIYDESNQLIETRSPISTFSILRNGVWQEEQRSIISCNVYDSFGNVLTTIHDVGGMNQRLDYVYDHNNRLLQTLYPDSLVDNSGGSASSVRQESLTTLSETCHYNAFGELVASCSRSGQWRYWVYDKSGKMTYAVDTQGAVTEYHYDALNNLLKQTRYANLVSPVTEENLSQLPMLCTSSIADRNDYYTYDLDHNLIESRKDTQRSYDSLTGRYQLLEPTTRYQYNAFGERITTSTRISESCWETSTIEYDVNGLKTASCDAEGYRTVYQYNLFGQLIEETQYAERGQSASAKDRTVTFRYDALGQLTRKTLKQISTQRLTGNNYETVTKDLNTDYSYDPMGHVVSITDALGHTAYNYYNELGQLVARTGASTSAGRAATTFRYDALGQLIETRQWANGAAEADTQHLILNAGSDADIITQDLYDNAGHLLQHTDGTGHVQYYSYDADGNQVRSWQLLKQGDGSTLLQDKRYRYDGEGRLIQTATIKANGQWATEDARYNAFGEVAAKGINGEFSTQVDYDSAGRIWRSNTSGYFQIFLYDLSDRVTQVITASNLFHPQYEQYGVDLSLAMYETMLDFSADSAATVLQRQDNIYDAHGFLLQQRKDGAYTERDREANTAPSRTSQMQTVDRWGNVLTHTNALGYCTEYEYNAFDQVICQRLPEVNVVDEHGVNRLLKPVLYTAYDALGRAIAMTDANGHTVAKVLDEEGRLIAEIDALGYHRDKAYNLLGQQISSTSERGMITRYDYDKANRLIAVSAEHSNQQYTYDGEGHLTQQTDGTGATTRFIYDAQGNQIWRQEAFGAVTTYEYDDSGHKTAEHDANGNHQSWQYDHSGRVVTHGDLGGGHVDYRYNSNGLLIEETSNHGKKIAYHYDNIGQLQQYADEGLNEVVNYTYDAEGQMLSKDSSKAGDWAVETDHYRYDALGHLIEVRRRRPEDTNQRPDFDRALLSIDYQYDAVGNIRNSKVMVNYDGYQQTNTDEYFTYDANNRMLVNKGQLVNGDIVITSSQGSELGYDASGNIETAVKYEGGSRQYYRYLYDSGNQLLTTRKNGLDLQNKRYDLAGHVVHEMQFNSAGLIAQRQEMVYVNGQLRTQATFDCHGQEVSRMYASYDAMGNLSDNITYVHALGGQTGYTQSHHYTYTLWDSYQQSADFSQLAISGYPTTYGESLRLYNVNGQLKQVIDKAVSGGQNNSTEYLNSSLDGIRARSDSKGQSSYLTVAGKTIGDLRLENGTQKLEVYGGFSPTGSSQSQAMFFDHGQEKAVVAGVLPDAPQDNLGTCTLSAGDTLDNIAFAVYGDSSLWYLIADANGITDRNSRAGEKDSQLQAGQQLIIPPASGGHHNTNTHKVLSNSQLIGDTSATTPLPAMPPPSPTRSHHSFWRQLAKVMVAVVAAVALVMSAAALAAIVSGASLTGLGIGGLISQGTAFLAGSAGTIAGTAGGFVAGFVSNAAAQGAANLFGLQKGFDLKGALLSGLSTAATAGITKAFDSQILSNAIKSVPTTHFNLASAVDMIKQDAISQTINVSFNKHQHFDWQSLGVSAITVGLMGSQDNEKFNDTLHNKLGQGAPFASSQLQALTSSATSAATTGSHFNALGVLKDNLGNAVWSTLMQMQAEREAEQMKTTEKPTNITEGAYCQTPEENNEYSPIPEGLYKHKIENKTLNFDPYDVLSFCPDPDAKPVEIKKEPKTAAVKDKKIKAEPNAKSTKAVPKAKSEVNSSSNPENNFNLEDAENGLRKVYEEYGPDITATVEKMYRLESGNFSSLQYKRTGTPGMEARKGSKPPNYGWPFSFFKDKPEYLPIGAFPLKDNKGLSGVGGNAQKRGMIEYITFPSVEGGMMYLAYRIANDYHGNFALWSARNDVQKQHVYTQHVNEMSPKITRRIISEQKR